MSAWAERDRANALVPEQARLPGASRRGRRHRRLLTRYGCGAAQGTPHPGCFEKRGWICLIAKELTFLETPKRPQGYDTTGLAALDQVPRARREQVAATRGNADGFEKKGFAGKATHKSQKTKDWENGRIAKTHRVSEERGNEKGTRSPEPWCKEYRIRY